MATLHDLVSALTTHLEILDDKYKESKNVKDDVLNTLTFDGKGYQEWIDLALEALTLHQVASNPHETNLTQLGAYSTLDEVTLFSQKVNSGDLPISTIRFGEPGDLNTPAMPIGINSINQPLVFDGTTWTINSVHWLLDGHYLYQPTISGTYLALGGGMLTDIDLDNITIVLDVILLLQYHNTEGLRYVLVLDDGTYNTESTNEMFIAKGVLTSTSILFNDTDWFMRIGNYRITPNAENLVGSSIGFKYDL